MLRIYFIIRWKRESLEIDLKYYKFEFIYYRIKRIFMYYLVNTINVKKIIFVLSYIKLIIIEFLFFFMLCRNILKVSESNIYEFEYFDIFMVMVDIKILKLFFIKMLFNVC